MDLRNESKNEFVDISSEAFRQYEFSADEIVTIKEPLYLSTNTKSGGHRILSADGVSHYIPGGWKHLSWKVKDGAPHFVK